MLHILAFALLAAGVALACLSRHLQHRRLALLRAAGVLLVGGLVALGFAFPFFD